MVVFNRTLNVAGMNYCIIHNENNSSKSAVVTYGKKFPFETMKEQHEERAVCPILPIDFRAEIGKLSRTETGSLPPLKEKRGICPECRGKDRKTQYYWFCCYKCQC